MHLGQESRRGAVPSVARSRSCQAGAWLWLLLPKAMKVRVSWPCRRRRTTEAAGRGRESERSLRAPAKKGRCTTFNLTLPRARGSIGIRHLCAVSFVRSILCCDPVSATDSDTLAQLIASIQLVVQWRVHSYYQPEAKPTTSPKLPFGDLIPAS